MPTATVFVRHRRPPRRICRHSNRIATPTATAPRGPAPHGPPRTFTTIASIAASTATAHTATPCLLEPTSSNHIFLHLTKLHVAWPFHVATFLLNTRMLLLPSLPTTTVFLRRLSQSSPLQRPQQSSTISARLDLPLPLPTHPPRPSSSFTSRYVHSDTYIL